MTEDEIENVVTNFWEAYENDNTLLSRKHTRTLISQKPDNAYYNYLCGLVERDDNNYDLAMTFFQKGFEYDPYHIMSRKKKMKKRKKRRKK